MSRSHMVTAYQVCRAHVLFLWSSVVMELYLLIYVDCTGFKNVTLLDENLSFTRTHQEMR